MKQDKNSTPLPSIPSSPTHSNFVLSSHPVHVFIAKGAEWTSWEAVPSPELGKTYLLGRFWKKQSVNFLEQYRYFSSA